jgi:hypothetical protein
LILKYALRKAAFACLNFLAVSRLYFASDTANFLARRHINTLDHAADVGEITRDRRALDSLKS